jgi:AcrR family transcriptional regulator
LNGARFSSLGIMGAMSKATPLKRPAGRKRDPRIEPLVLDAAIELYAIEGLAGLSFDAVARASGVGKPAVYRRWESRETLLVSALERAPFPTARDLGSLEEDIGDYVRQWVDWYASPFLPQAGVRVLIDCSTNPRLAELYAAAINVPRGSAARQVTRRAVARGELPDGTPATLLPELMLGGMFMHWALSLDRQTPDFTADMQRQVDRLVGVILAGLCATAPETSR